MAQEEVLNTDDVTRETPSAEEGASGLIGLSLGWLNSMVVRILIGAIAVVAVMLLSVGISIWTVDQYLTNSSVTEGSSASATSRMPEEPRKTYDLEENFIMTKLDPRYGRMRTIKLHIVLAYNRENTAVRGELKAREPQIRDLIYELLGGKSVEELDYDQKRILQDQLVKQVNKVLTGGRRIQDVYFTEYVLQ